MMLTRKQVWRRQQHKHVREDNKYFMSYENVSFNTPSLLASRRALHDFQFVTKTNNRFTAITPQPDQHLNQ